MTDFAIRHIGPTPAEQRHMLGSLGYSSLDELTTAALPEGLHQMAELDLPDPVTEAQALAALRTIAGRNRVLTSMIGLGYHDTITPAVIRRNMLESPAWYTAYTPYQPEISQGRLEALLTFQTLIEDLTGLPVAGASLLDEAHRGDRSGAADAPGQQGRDLQSFVLDADCLPQTLAVVRGRAAPSASRWSSPTRPTACPTVTPSASSSNPRVPAASYATCAPLIAAARDRGMLTTVAADLLSLTLVSAPGEQGADIAVGSAQRFGVPLFFGGPHAGYMSVRTGLERMLPGRLVGVSVDVDGRPAYRLALQTREQHIRRDKATSNICTAQALLANVAAMYAAYHGPEGLRAIATRVHGYAVALAAGLRAAGPRSSTTGSSTPSWCGSPAARNRSCRPPTCGGGSTCAWSTPTTSVSPATSAPPTT